MTVEDAVVDYHQAVAAVVNGKAFPVDVDVNDVLRFQSHKWVNPRLAEKMEDWDKFLNSAESRGRVPAGIYDPNDMFMDMYEGVWTREEVVAQQTCSGYSVSGLCDLSTVDSLDLYHLDEGGDLFVVTYIEPSDDDDEDM